MTKDKAGLKGQSAGRRGKWWTCNLPRNLINHTLVVSFGFTPAYRGSIVHPHKVMILCWCEWSVNPFFPARDSSWVFLAEPAGSTATLKQQSQGCVYTLIGLSCADECSWAHKQMNIDRLSWTEMSEASFLSDPHIHAHHNPACLTHSSS